MIHPELIGIVSDTHGARDTTRAAVRVLQSFGVETVIHCGDVGMDILSCFDSFNFHFTFGNTDYLEYLLSEMERSKAHVSPEMGELTLGSKKIAFLHGDDFSLLKKVKESGDWDVVCYGHTHKAEIHWEKKTLVINPGALYRASRHTIALLNLKKMDAAIVDI